MHTELDIAALETTLQQEHGRVISIREAVQADTILTQAVTRLKLKRLAMRSIPATQAAEIMGMHPQGVRRIYNDPDFRREVLETVNEAFDDVDGKFVQAQKTIYEQLDEEAFEAFKVLKDMLHDEDTNASHKIKIAQDFLDRSEATSQKRTNISKRVDLEADALARAARTAQEMDEAYIQRIEGWKQGKKVG